MPRRSRRTPATIGDARNRFTAAEAYLTVAELVLDDDSAGMPGVAAALAVLAGIAASDAICARNLREIHRGEDHREAAGMLETATPEGRELARTFRKLIDLKDEAHYGLTVLSRPRARNAVRWGTVLVDEARRQVQR
jgi:hypothetical protein